MEAALFTMRCLETAETNRPFFVTSFIVYGTSETILAKAETLFAENRARCNRPCGRVHKTGPLPLRRFIIPDSAGEEIDWRYIARRIEDERTRRPIDQGSCIFQEVRRGPLVKVEIEGQTATVEFDADLDDKLLKAIQPLPSLKAPPTFGPTFLFIGSLYETDLAERIGDVLLIEAANLEEAANTCSAVLARAQNACVHVEWCCPVHKTDP